MPVNLDRRRQRREKLSNSTAATTNNNNSELLYSWLCHWKKALFMFMAVFYLRGLFDYSSRALSGGNTRMLQLQPSEEGQQGPTSNYNYLGLDSLMSYAKQANSADDVVDNHSVSNSTVNNNIISHNLAKEQVALKTTMPPAAMSMPPAATTPPPAVTSASSSSSSSPLPSMPVVDVLSIGSNTRLDLLAAQQQTIGSHVSVRHFVNVTEDDDSDPQCSLDVTAEQVYEISKFCHRQHHSSYFMQYMRNGFAAVPWLQKKANPVGWLCAQRRPLHGLYKLFQTKYATQQLPDYLVVLDDDTHWNVEQFHKLYEDDTPDLPLVRAGCLVRSPIHLLNFTFAFGGFGVVLNKAALQKLLTPITCSSSSNYSSDTAGNNLIDHHEICQQIMENQIGEANLFQNGMALIDLIQAYTSSQPYRDFANWQNGYCLHSDWAMGYFINFYNISRQSTNPYFKDVPTDRMEPWLESEIYSRATGNCRNDGKTAQCRSDSLVCHYMTPEAMISMTNEAKAQSPPDHFRW